MAHLTGENMKTIANTLSHKATAIKIVDFVRCDPITIYKEIKKIGLFQKNLS